jgi:hypothetical protein
MKMARKMIAIAGFGLVLGVGMSVFGTAPAGARIYSSCDNKITIEEKQAAKDYAKGKITAEEYANIEAEIAYHRQLWGC